MADLERQRPQETRTIPAPRGVKRGYEIQRAAASEVTDPRLRDALSIPGFEVVRVIAFGGSWTEYSEEDFRKYGVDGVYTLVEGYDPDLTIVGKKFTVDPDGVVNEEFYHDVFRSTSKIDRNPKRSIEYKLPLEKPTPKIDLKRHAEAEFMRRLRVVRGQGRADVAELASGAKAATLSFLEVRDTFFGNIMDMDRRMVTYDPDFPLDRFIDAARSQRLAKQVQSFIEPRIPEKKAFINSNIEPIRLENKNPKPFLR